MNGLQLIVKCKSANHIFNALYIKFFKINRKVQIETNADMQQKVIKTYLNFTVLFINLIPLKITSHAIKCLLSPLWFYYLMNNIITQKLT